MTTKLSIEFHKDDEMWYVYHGEGEEQNEYIFDYWSDVQDWLNQVYFWDSDYSFEEEDKRRQKHLEKIER
ncbi:MAG: hypothetical protein H8E05_00110 [Bacteroidetes bacterium]|nr:hypothetical protein [Bacteroidota bacterium]